MQRWRLIGVPATRGSAVRSLGLGAPVLSRLQYQQPYAPRLRTTFAGGRRASRDCGRHGSQRDNSVPTNDRPPGMIEPQYSRGAHRRRSGATHCTSRRLIAVRGSAVLRAGHGRASRAFGTSRRPPGCVRHRAASLPVDREVLPGRSVLLGAGLREGAARTQVGAGAVVVEDAQDLRGFLPRAERMRLHRGELGRLAGPDEDGPLAQP
jgi:hypothetical protein